MSLDATLLLVALLGAVLVATFSFSSGRDRDGNLAISRTIGLKRLHWRTGDTIATWGVRGGWLLIIGAGFAQFSEPWGRVNQTTAPPPASGQPCTLPSSAV